MVYTHAHNNSDDLQMASSSGSSSFELLPLEGATSPVWEYFGFRAIDGQYIVKKKKDRKEVYCKLCKKVSFLLHTCVHEGMLVCIVHLDSIIVFFCM